MGAPLITSPPPLNLENDPMDPASAAAGSIGIPPISLSAGPSNAESLATGTSNGTGTTGDFVFKGSGRAGGGATLENVTPILALIGVGGAIWLIAKRLR